MYSPAIQGTSNVNGYKEYIDLLDFSYNMKETNKYWSTPTFLFDNYKVTKHINPRSVDLNSFITERKSLGKNVIIVSGQMLKNGTQFVPFERHEIEDPFIQSYKRRKLVETATLRFDRMKLKHYQLNKNADVVNTNTFEYIAHNQTSKTPIQNHYTTTSTPVEKKAKQVPENDQDETHTLSRKLKSVPSYDRKLYTKKMLEKIQLPAGVSSLSYKKKNKISKGKSKHF